MRMYDEARDAQSNRQIALEMVKGMEDILSARDEMLDPTSWEKRRAELEIKLDAERPALEQVPDSEELTDDEKEADEDAETALEYMSHKRLFTPRHGAEGIFALAEMLGEDGHRAKAHSLRATPTARRVLATGEPYAGGVIVTNEPTYQSVSLGGDIITTTGRQITAPVVVAPTHMTGATGLSQLERALYETCAMTAQGDPCLPHETRHRRAWHSDASQVRHKWPSLTAAAAEELTEAFRVIDIGAIVNAPQMRRMFQAMDTAAGVKRGYYYFLSLAAELLEVAPEDDEPLVDYVADPEPDDDAPELPMLSAGAYHLLDDPRDDPDNPASVQWIDKPKNRKVKAVVERIRKAADLPALKRIGVSLFGVKSKDKDNIDDAVVWAEYHSRKAALTPPLSPRARYVIKRLTEGVSTAQVAAWLHGDGKATLKPTDLAACWSAWKEAKAGQAAVRDKRAAALVEADRRRRAAEPPPVL